jgi:hypothetical protein
LPNPGRFAMAAAISRKSRWTAPPDISSSSPSAFTIPNPTSGA